MTPTDSLDRRAHVVPDLSPARIDATWDAIDARTARPSRTRAIAALSVVVAAAAAITFVLWPRGDAGTWAGTTLSSAAAPVSATLADGSEILAAPHTTLRREEAVSQDEVRVRLERGEATFDVARNPSRTFVVVTDGVEVRVIGTRFTVTHGERIEVAVERGAVDVREGERVRRVRAGESWRQVDEVATAEPVAPEVEEPTDEPEAEAPPRRPSAAELFEAARTARRDGAAAEAARLYERMLRNHPRNPRSGLAAFELGRLRMDELDDPRGAIRAFRRALRSGRSPFAQDARARIVRAHAHLGERAACQDARDEYLARHPDGRHVNAVTTACD